MKDISQYISNAKTGQARSEFIWDELRYKVILFVDNDPIAYSVLKDDENSFENALSAASVLLNGGGTRLNKIS